jgi:hypothetical protein
VAPLASATARAWATGIDGTAQAALPVPTVLNCGRGHGLKQPKSLTLACADGNTLGKNLAWSKWASTAAAATGTYTWNTCTSTCGASKKMGRRSHKVHPQQLCPGVRGPAVRKACGQRYREDDEGSGPDLGSERSSGLISPALVGSTPKQPQMRCELPRGSGRRGQP